MRRASSSEVTKKSTTAVAHELLARGRIGGGGQRGGAGNVGRHQQRAGFLLSSPV